MKKNIVLVDIDGTISKVGDRIKYLKQPKKDWDTFYNACFEDEPIEPIIDLINTLRADGYRIVFCTGRRESVREITKQWIAKNVDMGARALPFDRNLLMRKDGDYRHDTIAKPELVSEAGIELNDIAFVLEDRNSMVAKWRELGVMCLQVAEGDF